MTTKPASASIRLSAPKPIRAIEPAATPATTAIANSTTCQRDPAQASSRARRSSRARSAGDGPIGTGASGRSCRRAGAAASLRSDTEPSAPWREHGARRAPALVGERVHHHLSLPARAHDAVRAHGAYVMRDEVLGALDDPGEIADTQLVGFGQRAASVSRVGSASARAFPPATRPRPTSSRRRRSRSAVGRSRQSRSQRSSDTATF